MKLLTEGLGRITQSNNVRTVGISDHSPYLKTKVRCNHIVALCEGCDLGSEDMSSTYSFEFHIELETEDGSFLVPVYLHILKSQLPWFAEIQGKLRAELESRIACEYGALDRAYRRLVVEKNDPTCLSIPKLLPSDLCKLYVALKSSTIHHNSWFVTQSEANERRGTVPYQMLTPAEGGGDRWEEKKIGDFALYVYAFPLDDTENVKMFVLNEDPAWSLASDKATTADP